VLLLLRLVAALAEIELQKQTDNEMHHSRGVRSSEFDNAKEQPPSSVLTLFGMLSGSFLFAMLVLFCTLRLRCLDRTGRQAGERRTLQPKKKGLTEADVEQRCPVTPCTVSDNPTCVVCLTPVEEGEPCRVTQCGHSFHADCIMHWWMYKPRKTLKCPVCRTRQRRHTHVEPKALSAEHEMEECQQDVAAMNVPDSPDIVGIEKQNSFSGRPRPTDSAVVVEDVAEYDV
jgi:hypothetical protein